MSAAKEIKQLQKAKSKAQSSSNLREEANLCNQLGEVLARSGDYQAAIEEHRQELALSEVLHDVIGCAVANRKIGECYAEQGNIEAALKHQRRHLDLARSLHDLTEEQRALATIGRTYLFLYDSDQSRDSLERAKDAFRKSLAILDEHLEGKLAVREVSEMRARLLLNLGYVYDGLKEPQRCSDFIRQSIFIAEKNSLFEDLYRANFNLGEIHFKRGQRSGAIRCFEQAKECARKLREKFSESECFHRIGKVLLSLGDFAAARRSLKKAYALGSQLTVEREAVRRDFKHAIRGCQLEEAALDVSNKLSQESMGLAEQLGDLFCKAGCYSKALEAYHTQLSCAEALGKPAREQAVIHVSLAATHSDLRQFGEAVEHYHHELALRQGNPREECETWLNIAVCQEESGQPMEGLDSSYSRALACAERAGQTKLQRRVLRAWLAARRRGGASQAEDTEARLRELCASEGRSLEDVEEEEEEEEDEPNSEPLEDSDIQLSDSDEDMEGYDKVLSGRRKSGRWNKRNEKGETSLHRACIDGNLRQVQYLLDQGHPVNPRDYCGWTPLHEACNHGHQEVVALLLERGASINDPGGPHCEGVTPLHDALSCGHFHVARLLVERGASATVRSAKGDSPLDSLRHWFRTYRRDLDQQTKKECEDTEKILRRALAAGGVLAASLPPRPVEALQDSPLFDAECSEPLLQGESWAPPSPARPRPRSPRSPGAEPVETRRRRSAGSSHRQRGAEVDVLYGGDSSSDSDGAISPLRPVRPRQRFLAAACPQEAPCSSGEVPCPVDAGGAAVSSQSPSGRAEYQQAMQSLGSAKTRLLSQSLSEPAFSSTPATTANSRPALVPEDEYVADDWLEDDLGDVQPKKKRRVGADHGDGRERLPSPRSHTSIAGSSEARVQVSSRRGLSLKKSSSKSRQVKMNQLPGMVMLGRREVGRSQSPTVTSDDDLGRATPPRPPCPQAQNVVVPLPAPIRMRVRVQDNVFLIPVPHSTADSCTVAWLCEQAAQRYYQICGLLPRLSLQKEGALLSPQDLLLTVLHTNEEVLAEVTSWDLPPLPERYRKACHNLAVDENKRVSGLCELQDGRPCMSVCGLSLTPSALAPFLRALKLQASVTELRISGNRLPNNLLPELFSAATTMPRLRLLDISANDITGEGLKRAAEAIEGMSQPALPCLEELDLSMNALGDGWSQALASVLSSCPLLAKLSLQACSLSARFLQQHRLLLATALEGTGHLKSVCLSHNALGCTGFELVLRTLPLHSLTHLDLSAVCRGHAEQPALEHLNSLLIQTECSLTHLRLAGNGLTDHSIISLSKCLHVCPSLVSLDLSANPAVTSAGLHTLLCALNEAQRSLTFLNLQGCQVSGPWDAVCLDSLAKRVCDLRLCSQRLNKLDQDALRQSWSVHGDGARILSRSAKCLLSTAALSH